MGWFLSVLFQMVTRIPPFLIVALTGALAFLSVLKVRFSSDLYELLPRDLPEVRGMEQINRYFSRHGQLIVAVKGESAWAAEEAGAALAQHLRGHPERVAEVFEELSLEELVGQGGELVAWAWLNARPEAVTRLAEHLGPDRSPETIADSLATVRDDLSTERALVTSYDPLGLARLGGGAGDDEAGAGARASSLDPMRSEDGSFEIFYLEGRGVDFTNYREARKWLDGIRGIVAGWQSEWRAGREAGAAVRIGLTGTPAFMAEVGTAMERDMTVSVVTTLVLISLLFYLMHRQLRPLSWLMAAMFTILAATMAIGSLLFGEMSVMSVGFAAILMGLAVDYGIVLYGEAISSKRTAREVRRAAGAGVGWAAATTALVFLSLNFSSLPGLAQMGNLVALGVAIGAGVMLFVFNPVAVQFARGQVGSAVHGADRPSQWMGRAAVGLAFLVPALAAVSVVTGKRLELEPNYHPFRIRESPSMTAWNEVQRELRGREQAVPAIVTGGSLTELHERLAGLAERAGEAQEEGLIDRALLPTDWIPHPAHQRGNAETLRALGLERDRLLGELDTAGFSEQGSALVRSVFAGWERFLRELESQEVVLPSGSLAEWTIGRVFREAEGTVAALAAVTPHAPRDRAWVERICDEHTNVASLSSLGTALNERIRGDLWRVFLPMAGLLVLALVVVFRSWRDVLLSLFCLGFAGAGLLLVTQWTPFRWNSFNIFGLPLLFGTGLDFSIHMILALRRERECGRDGGRGEGMSGGIRRAMGRALVFCGTSSAIGFGSLATASASGLASLGLACAAGILINMAGAVWLLPHWYRLLHRLRD